MTPITVAKMTNHRSKSTTSIIIGKAFSAVSITILPALYLLSALSGWKHFINLNVVIHPPPSKMTSKIPVMTMNKSNTFQYDHMYESGPLSKNPYATILTIASKPNKIKNAFPNQNVTSFGMCGFVPYISTPLSGVSNATMTPFKITTNKIAREKYIEFATLLHIFRTGFEACKKPRDRSKLSLFDTVSLMDVFFFFFFPDDDDGDLLLLFFPSSSALKPSFKVYPPPFLSFVVFFPSYRSSS
mmetsp:Transcript_3202/g.10904  ORF Transcript_3202/g.10904 Transcript_3202/m.10904 type:complete len:243 (+) Transcript_3202:5221-5949(+)